MCLSPLRVIFRFLFDVNDKIISFVIIIQRCLFKAMKPHEIQEKLGLTRIRDRNWYVQPSCATTGDGLYEGLSWLTSNHKLWSRAFGRENLHSCQVIFLISPHSVSKRFRTWFNSISSIYRSIIYSILSSRNKTCSSFSMICRVVKQIISIPEMNSARNCANSEKFRAGCIQIRSIIESGPRQLLNR